MSDELKAQQESGGGMVVKDPIENPEPVQKAELPVLSSSYKAPANLRIAPFMDVGLNVSVVLGKTVMSLGDLLKLGAGAVIELNRPMGDPIDVLVNDRFFAKGEIVVIEESFGVRILEIAENQQAEAA